MLQQEDKESHGLNTYHVNVQRVNLGIGVKVIEFKYIPC